MYKIFQNGEKMKLPLPSGETLKPAANVRSRRERDENLPHFCREMARLVELAGTSQNEFASLMTGQTGTEISPARLSSWLRGVVPKNTKKRPTMVEDLLKAAEIVAARGGAAPSRVDATTVSRQIKAWLAAGRSRRQIQMAGELSQATLSSWELGLVDVPLPKWERVKLMVEKLFAILDMEAKLKEAGVDFNIPGLQSVFGGDVSAEPQPEASAAEGGETQAVPVPKKRGRPRKIRPEASADLPPAGQAAGPAADGEPVKRKRGRPRKNPLPQA